MNDEEKTRNELLDTTDYLEVIGVFRAMKNFLFIVALVCLLLLQVCFWLVEFKYVVTDEQPLVGAQVSCPRAAVCPFIKLAAETPPITTPVPPQPDVNAQASEESPNQPAREAVQQPAPAAEGTKLPLVPIRIKFSHLTGLIRLCNFVLVISATLYSLVLLFTLKVSLIGRLGGINYITRAFFMSVFMLVFLFPWQRFFGGVVAGAIFTPQELLKACTPAEPWNAVTLALHYLRFSGLWAIAFLLLIFAQIRTVRWARATLRRLAVI